MKFSPRASLFQSSSMMGSPRSYKIILAHIFRIVLAMRVRNSNFIEMNKAFTVKLKTILMRHADKRKRIKQGRRMKQMTKYMIMKRKSVNRDKISIISMHPLKKNIIIPDDVIPEILVKLPARSVGRFRCICKSWLSITTNLPFIRAHTEHNRFANQSLIVEGLNTSSEGNYLASVDSNTDLGITLSKLHGMRYHEVIASCDGLLYISIFYDEYIINPLTGYSISFSRGMGIFLGFYFHCSTSKYRIIYGTNEIVVMTSVLVVGERSWRHLPWPIPCCLPHSEYHKSLDLNGCLFWLAFKEQSHCKQPSTIMTFDTESEVYSLLSLPPSDKLLNIVGSLVDFNGKLGLWVADNNIVDVWIMEKCWVKRYSINYFDLTGCSVQFGRLEDRWVGGAAVFVKDKELLIDVSEAGYLFRCNLKSGACCFHQREIVCGGSPVLPCIGSYPYMETLVYPDCCLT
ncbi:putative F-box protein [Platanthera guangdongensis]|uniref:F-box protein n=1 Tax=Platanthera guangdongensis TaxID=2320717 RepID=A0ABR2LBY3_9ASPA